MLKGFADDLGKLDRVSDDWKEVPLKGEGSFEL
jgi:hypothetical protein